MRVVHIAKGVSKRLIKERNAISRRERMAAENERGYDQRRVRRDGSDWADSIEALEIYEGKLADP